MIKIVFVRM